MQKLSSLTAVLPCYNEKASIEAAVRSLYAEAGKLSSDFELLAVDGNSADGTLELLRSLEKELPQLRVLVQPRDKRGHGRALLLGYAAASKDWIFQTDSDAQFDITELPKLAQYADKLDFISGIRTPRRDPPARLLLTAAIKSVIFLVSGVRLKDPNCPFRLMRVCAIKPLLARIPDDTVAPNIFLSILAATGGLRRAEVPVTHLPRKDEVKRQRMTKLALKGLIQLIRFRPVWPRNPAQ
ncbi:MAG: glycosyltransferase family 2 protein [Elusimicrobia bacterium]|nr:glycosyltransferase family 2 protein [Elusimicrobiota bacterium]